jgi:putative transposase
MVTKRVHKRQMLLIEDDYVTQVLEYTLAYCMSKYDQPLHAFVVEGNHYHRVDGDPEGLRPQFIQELHSLIARQLNRYYGEGDAFFSSKQTNIVDNETPADVLERIVYAMGNPVADGIEREGRNHKGIRVRWPQPDKIIKRPEGFWRSIEDGGVAPDELVLRFTRPPGYDDLSDDELDLLIENRVLAYEQDKREERDDKGLAFRCDVTDEKPDPRSFPKSRHQLFRLAPLLGARLKEQRLAAITRLREFRARHKEARLRMKAGEQGVVFPFGTYLAVRRWNVLIESAPT